LLERCGFEIEKVRVGCGLEVCGCGPGADKKFQPAQDSNTQMAITSAYGRPTLNRQTARRTCGCASWIDTSHFYVIANRHKWNVKSQA